ncbi:MAG: bifunctional demethylmenaquinone methyltransferase/2-methoxy-6-polyprenyl-1,4-benzoquinol methylase UbiE [Bacteroidales bacterium]|nr:bifunctional demethylmenaquinone methyltransferase/2-methoxy-6-polyprenyl-1,4-benzoquinol methylase UbiE [Bacteroidales bacterium]
MQITDVKMDIAHLFDRIAPHYDFLNHFLSFGIDKYWRKKAIRQLSPLKSCYLLDVACGTGDLAFEAIKQGAKQVKGIDISEEMLKIAVKKNNQKFHYDNLSFQQGSSHEIPFPNESFDAVTVAFGVRNFAHLEIGLHEIFRVLKDNATLLILEFSMPENRLMACCYKIYFHRFLPILGGCISGDKKAYQYLPHSVMEFPQGNDFLKILSKIGFSSFRKIKLSCGIAHIYIAKKQVNHQVENIKNEQ